MFIVLKFGGIYMFNDFILNFNSEINNTFYFINSSIFNFYEKNKDHFKTIVNSISIIMYYLYIVFLYFSVIIYVSAKYFLAIIYSFSKENKWKDLYDMFIKKFQPSS